ncbi:hypothetical protein TrLO_g1709 [Triparma laevis f. longispina]|uniref:DUF2061 domain-containing protein n=1 Tax=Triparma laevis f. longispina TaxID=1714387 RepID=A0A9W7KZG9_9STRA|nr:hypothetical protein TrLO_g1709 [Triparma laevis f. longispina]
MLRLLTQPPPPGPRPQTTTLPSTAISSIPSSSASSDLKRIEKIMTVETLKRQRQAALLEETENKLKRLENLRDSYLDGKSIMESGMQEQVKETTARSAVKSMSWRVIAGTVTLITSLKYSGSLKTALTIVGSDFFSKAATMFLGERMMNQSQAGRTKDSDGVGRSLTKAIIWRLFAVANTLCMAVFIAKDLSIASKIASTDAVIKTTMMFFYERFWAKVDWGKEYDVDFSI